MRAEIITIGDELLIGQTVDTNSAWMGAELSKLGFSVYRRTSVGDRENEILAALSESEGRSEVILVTGGLGPTSDDITKPSICKHFDTKLVRNYEVLNHVKNMLSRRGYPMNDNNERQSDLPENCTVLKNEAGTAPGMLFERKGSVFVFMPGVPYEMKHLMLERVIPLLKERYRSQSVIHKTIMTYGSFEAKLAETLSGFENELPGFVKLAYLPTYGVIKLRLTAAGNDSSYLRDIIDKQTEKLRGIIGDIIFSENEESLEVVIANELLNRNKTLSVAESCTGGKLSSLLTSLPGASKWYAGSVVAYSNEIKTAILGVSQKTLMDYGAVSREVAEEMASGTRKLLGTDFALATTGIAGPDGGTAEKPVGTVCISVSSVKKTNSEKLQFGTDRITNINRFSVAALNLLRLHLRDC